MLLIRLCLGFYKDKTALKLHLGVAYPFVMCLIGEPGILLACLSAFQKVSRQAGL